MGYSERLAERRTFAQRVADLGDLTDELGLTGPVVTVAHDWGGPISLGWAEAHASQLRGIVLTNTGVHLPSDAHAPALIRLARSPVLRERGLRRHARRSSAPRPRCPARRCRPLVRDAFAAPYDNAARRQAIGDFVEDIPLEPEHISAAALGAVRGRPHRAQRRAGAAALGSARPGVRRALPARPDAPAATSRRPALRGRLPPRARGRTPGGRRDQPVGRRPRPRSRTTIAPPDAPPGRAWGRTGVGGVDRARRRSGHRCGRARRAGAAGQLRAARAGGT